MDAAILAELRLEIDIRLHADGVDAKLEQLADGLVALGVWSRDVV
jgi:hypothetical protein